MGCYSNVRKTSSYVSECTTGFLVIALVAFVALMPTVSAQNDVCAGCGYVCDANCNCGRCNTKPGCMSEDTCLTNCNGGKNAKWCGAPAPTPPTPPTPPAPPTPPPAPPTPGYPGTCHAKSGGFDGPACGYACDGKCNCGVCNTKPGCMSEGQCLGTCNGGKNAKWCGAAPPPPPPTPPVPPPTPPAVWTTGGNKLQMNGKDVVLKGMGTTCTEYLLRGIGMKCWVDYSFSTPADIFSLNLVQLYPLIDYLRVIVTDGVVPVVRIPMTASSWLGVRTAASGGNMDAYPKLNEQYQNIIADMVSEFTRYDIVTILDLHWTDDDTDNAPFAGNSNTSCVDFWDSVAARFANNSKVFYELYNEPHRVDEPTWANGDSSGHNGMLQMLAAVRKHTTSPVIIAGFSGYAYDSASLVTLDKTLVAQGEKNVVWNFHPYMGPNQAGDDKKCPAGFESYLQALFNGTDKPAIITEFGQGCQPTNAASEKCPASTMGYDEAILTVAEKYTVSWLPWAWRPMAGGPNTKNCQDLNGGTDPAGLSLAHPTDGNGADFMALWTKFAGGAAPPAPPTPPSACPGGSLAACIGLCPANPPAAYQACVLSCTTRCT